MSNDELAIRNLIDTWCRATEAGDVDALAPLMADDIVFLTPGREPFGKREFLEGSRQSAGTVKVSVQADVKEVRVAGDLGYCWLKLAVTVTPPDGGPPMHHAGQTIGIYRREGGGGCWRGTRISWCERLSRSARTNGRAPRAVGPDSSASRPYHLNL